MTRRTLGRILIALASVFIASPLWGDETKSADLPKKEDFHVFILMGQSNMSGYGKIEPGDKEPVPRVFKIPTRGKRNWTPASHPLHNRLKSDRFGLGLPFARTYLKDKPEVAVGLVPMAWGGAPIDKLMKGSETYRETIEKARLASQRGTLTGVLWHQGESDTVTKARSEAYERKLHRLIQHLRQDLGEPNLPFIVGNLAEFYGTGKEHRAPDRVGRIDKVRNVLRSLSKKVEGTGFVESTGCTSPDHHMVHFDRRSYIILGERYAQVFSAVIAKSEAGAPEPKSEGKVKPEPEAEARSR